MEVSVTVQIGAPQVRLLTEEAESYQQVLKGLERPAHELQSSRSKMFLSGEIISGKNIDEFYPAKRQKPKTKHGDYQLPSPIKVLSSAQTKLRQLRNQAHCQHERVQSHSSSGSSSPVSEEEGVSSPHLNTQMLTTVMDILENDLTICASLLGAFMGEQICIPLVNSPQETAKAVSYTEVHPSVGVGALFSLKMIDLEQMFRSVQGQALSILITISKEYSVT